ncbi:hypothetical protein [Halobacillus aidingensis]|uniref:DUF304 domain-containing protein n=1 Tax=Halobacillus aidingensis TaxID=240303 RepID=A0A1H0JYL3_HALAD|nr:hypothetical protein [Halobacillus aidingensis]SDO48501.1 hypothetical protein SAMN05421677_105164 [Halobacillus aidingensis]
MNYKYSNTELWRKKARGSLFNIIVSLLPAVLSLYLHGRIEPFIVFGSGVVFLIGLCQMLHYYKMPERDYVRVEDDILDIRIGIADPNARLADEEIKRIQQMDDVISIKSDKGEEENIYLENLSDEDAASLLDELKHQYGNRMHTKNHPA